MRLTKQQAAENRDRILAAAARLFRERGIAGVGVAEIMEAAGFTHGGFYNHFPSKEALVAEACQKELLRSASASEASVEALGPEAWPEFARAYLASEHRDHPESGCVVAALAADAGRAGVDVQAHFAESIEKTAAFFAHAGGSRSANERGVDEGLRRFSELVGALVLSRAVAKASPALSDKILAAARASVPSPSRRARHERQR